MTTAAVTADPVAHRVDCTDTARTEDYEQDAPRGGRVHVTRCITCNHHAYKVLIKPKPKPVPYELPKLRAAGNSIPGVEMTRLANHLETQQLEADQRARRAGWENNW